MLIPSQRRKRRFRRRQATFKQVLNMGPSGWELFVGVEVLIGGLVVLWYMVSYFYQLGYKNFYHIPTVYMEFTINRFLEPGKYLSITIFILLFALVLYLYKKMHLCLAMLWGLSPTILVAIIINYLGSTEMDAAEFSWMIVSILIFIIMMSIIGVYAHRKKIERGEKFDLKSIQKNDFFLMTLTFIAFLNVGAYLMGYIIQETQSHYYLLEDIEEPNNQQRDEKSSTDQKQETLNNQTDLLKKVVLDQYEDYYIVAPLIDGEYVPQFELVKIEEDEKIPPIQVSNNPIQFKGNPLEDKHLILTYVDTGKIKPDPQGIAAKINYLSNAGFKLKPSSDYLISKDGSIYRYFVNELFQSETAIYRRPNVEAHFVGGDIFKKYKELGEFNGVLGYPITDELSTLDGGRFNHFQNGSIYWTPETGAHVIYGPIRDKWESLQGERGPLGYPISDVQKEGDTLLSRFQGGIIKLTPQGQTIVIQKSLDGLRKFKNEVVILPTYINSSFIMEGDFEPTATYLSAKAGDQITVCATGEPNIGKPEENNLFFFLYNQGRPLKPGLIAKIDGDYQQECAKWTIERKGNYQVLFTRKKDDSQIIVHYTMKLNKK